MLLRFYAPEWPGHTTGRRGHGDDASVADASQSPPVDGVASLASGSMDRPSCVTVTETDGRDATTGEVGMERLKSLWDGTNRVLTCEPKKHEVEQLPRHERERGWFATRPGLRYGPLGGWSQIRLWTLRPRPTTSDYAPAAERRRGSHIIVSLILTLQGCRLGINIDPAVHQHACCTLEIGRLTAAIRAPPWPNGTLLLHV